MMHRPKVSDKGLKEIFATLHNQLSENVTDSSIFHTFNELKDIINALDDSTIITITDHNGTIISANDTFCAISKYKREELFGKNHRILKSGYHSDAFYQNMWQTISSGHAWEGEMKNQAKDGSYYWVKTKIIPYLDQTTNDYNYIAIQSDITKGKALEERLRQSVRNDYEEVIKNIGNSVFKVRKKADQPFTLTFFEGKLANKFGLKTNNVYGKELSEIFPADVVTVFKEYLHEALLGEVVTFEYPSGDQYFHVTLSPMFAGEDVTEVVGTINDITEVKRYESTVEHMAYHHPLTDLPNRSQLLCQLTDRMSDAKASQEPFTVVMIDLDHFKYINDSSGHSVGDEILLRVSERLKIVGLERYSPDFSLFHLGGDEFVFVVEGYTQSKLSAMIDEIFSVFKRPFQVNDIEYFLNASVGVSSFPTNGQNPEEVLKNADTAMFSAKERGRNTYQVYTSVMNRNLLKKLQIEMDLRKALRNDEFILYYQPQLDLRNQKICGVEALIRWQHPTKGFISPGEFIPVAEDTGLVVPLGEWVLKHACEQVKCWEDAGITDLRVSVNIATTHFQRRDFVEMVEAILAETGVEGKSLELEITENSLMEYSTETTTILKRLNQLGIRISIDDFGTGYSSLAYLKKFPISTLKIDQSFVRDLTTDFDDRAIVTTIINLAKNLRLKVIAEGVETNEALDFLTGEGCDEMQGYLFSKPVAADEAKRLIRKVNDSD
ncbi:sensor domain-containing protein [Desertibacillus haloalkaliphilus]|uniref:sensor domain-containing protein n=1 Tax=Desertibacillus haloalkaliphilus TaxID=1328930 RepID=UPI001C2622F8|nr:EAL domain-containing protein [Desertibacillus haloalkaliphilus]MBU8905135.1 EAL domain-containing protein [Desertibacillus haloalkaliphilus]